MNNNVTLPNATPLRLETIQDNTTRKPPSIYYDKQKGVQLMKITIDNYTRRMGYTPVPQWYGLAYAEAYMPIDIYYPIPINYIVRYCRGFLWRFLRLFYWIGLIDISMGERFSWDDFFRIKSH